MFKIFKKIILAVTLVVLTALAFSSCTKNDGILEYKSVKGGYEVVGLADKDAENVEIPETFKGKSVIAIGDEAFRGTNIKSISIPSTVKGFGLNAFEYCLSLRSVELKEADSFADASFENIYSNPLYLGGELYVDGEQVKSLELDCDMVSDYAYAGCTSIESLKLSGVAEIGVNAFDSCKNLASVDFGASLEKIGSFGFSNNDALTEVELPDSVLALGHSVFSYNTALCDVSLPEGVCEIPMRAFQGCSALKNINLENIEVIGEHAFYDCVGLEALSISDKTQKICEYAFYNCAGVKVIDIAEGSALEAIEESAFRGCSALETLYLDRAESLKAIGKHAFEYCVSLKNLTLPGSLETLGDWSFASCDSLQMTVFEGVGYIGNDENPYILVYKLVDQENIDIELHDGAKFIHQGAFLNAKALSTVKIKSGVRSIGSQAFAFCTSLIEITIPATTKEIGDGAMMGCFALSTVYFSGSKDQWTNSKNENYVKKGTNWNYNAGKYSVIYGS